MESKLNNKDASLDASLHSRRAKDEAPVTNKHMN